MFGWSKRERIAQEDENELRCLEEIAEQYSYEKYGVTREYAMRCYKEYIEDVYERTKCENIDFRLQIVLDNIKQGDDRRAGLIDPLAPKVDPL
jgi:hypothetical protein